MHESSLVRGLVRKVEEVAREAGAERVTGVSVRLGALSPLSPESLIEHFDHATIGTSLQGASMHVVSSNDETDPNALEVILESVEVEV